MSFRLPRVSGAFFVWSIMLEATYDRALARGYRSPGPGGGPSAEPAGAARLQNCAVEARRRVTTARAGAGARGATGRGGREPRPARRVRGFGSVPAHHPGIPPPGGAFQRATAGQVTRIDVSPNHPRGQPGRIYWVRALGELLLSYVSQFRRPGVRFPPDSRPRDRGARLVHGRSHVPAPPRPDIPCLRDGLRAAFARRTGIRGRPDGSPDQP